MCSNKNINFKLLKIKIRESCKKTKSSKVPESKSQAMKVHR